MLESELLLECDRTHPRCRSKLAVKCGDAHVGDVGDGLDTQGLIVVSADPVGGGTNSCLCGIGSDESS